MTAIERTVSSIAPALLVSVRNAAEAVCALTGQVDILDIKEPANGSLGCATPQTIRAVAKAVNEFCSPSMQPARPRPLLSVALGEVGDWQEDLFESRRDYVEALDVLRPDYLKLGLAGLCGREMNSEWVASWLATRESFGAGHGGPRDWVGVAYADHQRANSPCVREVCDAAIRTGCSILLIDTFVKDHTTLLDWLSLEELQDIRRLTHRAGLRLALAGRITVNEISRLQSCGHDIVGVRGAVCEGGERTATVCAKKIQHLRDLLRCQV